MTKLIKLIDTDNNTVIIKAALVKAVLSMDKTGGSTIVVLDNDNRINSLLSFQELKEILNVDNNYVTFTDPDDGTDLLVRKTGVELVYELKKRNAVGIEYEEGTSVIVVGTADEVAEKLGFI